MEGLKAEADKPVIDQEQLAQSIATKLAASNDRLGARITEGNAQVVASVQNLAPTLAQSIGQSLQQALAFLRPAGQ